MDEVVLTLSQVQNLLTNALAQGCSIRNTDGEGVEVEPGFRFSQSSDTPMFISDGDDVFIPLAEVGEFRIREDWCGQKCLEFSHEGKDYIFQFIKHVEIDSLLNMKPSWNTYDIVIPDDYSKIQFLVDEQVVFEFVPSNGSGSHGELQEVGYHHLWCDVKISDEERHARERYLLSKGIVYPVQRRIVEHFCDFTVDVFEFGAFSEDPSKFDGVDENCSFIEFVANAIRKCYGHGTILDGWKKRFGYFLCYGDPSPNFQEVFWYQSYMSEQFGDAKAKEIGLNEGE